jgi:hypothetical protein
MSDETASLYPIASALADPGNQRLLEESVLTYQEIEHASDRVCAIVTAAWLEGRLQRALSWRLADPAYQKKNVFDGMLGAYAPKVRLGYLIGVYSEEAHENLLAIGSIRNRFAHRTDIRSFAHRELASFFKKITIYQRLINMGSPELRGLFPDPLPDHADERARFIASARTLEGYLLLDPFDHAPVMAHAPRF